MGLRGDHYIEPDGLKGIYSECTIRDKATVLQVKYICQEIGQISLIPVTDSHVKQFRVKGLQTIPDIVVKKGKIYQRQYSLGREINEVSHVEFPQYQLSGTTKEKVLGYIGLNSIIVGELFKDIYTVLQW